MPDLSQQPEEDRMNRNVRIRIINTIPVNGKTVLPLPRAEGNNKPSDFSIPSGMIDPAILTRISRQSFVRCQKIFRCALIVFSQ
jgi:hypothetical protein